MLQTKYLDIKTIKTDVDLIEKKVSAGVMLGIVLIFVVPWVVWSLGSVSNFLWSAIVFIPIIAMIVCVYLVQRRRMQAIENLDFCLVEDTCVKKEFVEGDSDADDRYILFFEKNGKYVETHGRHYANIAAGDRCYLLRLGGSKKAYWVTNKHSWDGLVGFEKRKDVYYPVKDDEIQK